MAADHEQLALPGPRDGRGYRIFHYAMMLVGAAAIVVIATAVGLGVHERLKPDPRVAGVHSISGMSATASSKLTRSAASVTEEFASSNLPQGHIVTLRAEVFNHPEKCTHADARGRCGTADLSAPGVDGSVVFVSSSWLRTTTVAQFDATLKKDDTTHAVTGKGLTNPSGAEIHFVLMDRGEPTSGDARLLSTLGQGCTSPLYGDGTPGAYACTDLQSAVHQP